MEDQRDPYAEPAASAIAPARARLWPSNLAAATTTALIGIVSLFRLGERQYFGDQSNDIALLQVALPYLVAFACLAGLASSISRRPRIIRSAILGIVVGPAIAFLAYQLYPLIHRWS